MIFRTLPMRKKRGITSSDYVMWHRQGILMRKKTGHARCFGIIVIPFIKTFIKNLCPVDFSPQTHSMNVFPHEKKVDIGVLPRAEASSRFRHHAQTYRFPNRSLVRKTRQGFRYHKKSKNKSRIYILTFRIANIYMCFKNKSWVDILWFLDVCLGCPNRFVTLWA